MKKQNFIEHMQKMGVIRPSFHPIRKIEEIPPPPPSPQNWRLCLKVSNKNLNFDWTSIVGRECCLGKLFTLILIENSKVEGF